MFSPSHSFSSYALNSTSVLNDDLEDSELVCSGHPFLILNSSKISVTLLQEFLPYSNSQDPEEIINAN